MKRILLVADVKGWIFDRHCNEIMRRLSHKYQFGLAYCRGFDVNALSKDYDLVYVLDPMPIRYPPKEKCIIGLRCEFLYTEHPEGAKGLYEKGYHGRCVSIKDKCSIMHVVNKRQMDAFKDVVTDKPLLLVRHGVDETTFDKNKYDRVERDNIVVGVAGRLTDNKGGKIIVDACRRCGVNFIAAEYGRRLSKEDMPDFYNKMDVYVCMSNSEGLNNPTMEAGAMGIPVISTRSGAAEEMLVDGVSGLLIDRNVESLCEAIEKMKDDKFRVAAGNAFYDEIMKNWLWSVKVNEYDNMFSMLLKE